MILSYICLCLHFMFSKDAARYADSVGGRLLKPAGDRRPVANRPEAVYAGFKIGVYDDLVGVEFYFYAVKKSLVACDAGRDLIKGQQHLSLIHIYETVIGDWRGTD